MWWWIGGLVIAVYAVAMSLAVIGKRADKDAARMSEDWRRGKRL